MNTGSQSLLENRQNFWQGQLTPGRTEDDTSVGRRCAPDSPYSPGAEARPGWTHPSEADSRSPPSRTAPAAAPGQTRAAAAETGPPGYSPASTTLGGGFRPHPPPPPAPEASRKASPRGRTLGEAFCGSRRWQRSLHRVSHGRVLCQHLGHLPADDHPGAKHSAPTTPTRRGAGWGEP